MVEILFGNAKGSFAAPVNYAVQLIPKSITAGDFNGDGKLDLAVGNLNAGTLSVLPGNGTFRAAAVTFGVGSSYIDGGRRLQR